MATGTVNPFLAKLKSRKRVPDYRKFIRTHGDPVLKQVCAAVVASDDLAFIETMCDVLMNSRNGVGLAAPQIGVTKRVILVAPHQSRGPLYVMINPVIVERSVELEVASERCLSFPGVTANVERHQSVKVWWEQSLTSSLPSITQEFTGWEARIVQHEIDHLNGICRVGEMWRGQSQSSV